MKSDELKRKERAIAIEMNDKELQILIADILDHDPVYRPPSLTNRVNAMKIIKILKEEGFIDG